MKYDMDDVKMASYFKAELSRLSTRQKQLTEAAETSTAKNANLEITEEKH